MPTNANNSAQALALMRFLSQQQRRNGQNGRRPPPNQNGVLLGQLGQVNKLGTAFGGQSDFGRNASDTLALLAALNSKRYAGAVKPGIDLANRASPGMIPYGSQIGNAAGLYQNLRDKNYLGAASSGVGLANNLGYNIPGGDVLGGLGAAYNIFRPGQTNSQRAISAATSAPQLYGLGTSLGLWGGAGAAGSAAASGAALGTGEAAALAAGEGAAAAGAGAAGSASMLGPIGWIIAAGILAHNLTGGGKENPKVKLGYGDGNISAWGYDSPFGKIGFNNIQTPHSFGESLQKYMQSFAPLDQEIAARMTPQQLEQARSALQNTKSYEFAFPSGDNTAGEQVVAQFLRDKYAAIYSTINPAAAQKIANYRGHSSGLIDAISQLHTDPNAAALAFKEDPSARRAWAPPGGDVPPPSAYQMKRHPLDSEGQPIDYGQVDAMGMPLGNGSTTPYGAGMGFDAGGFTNMAGQRMDYSQSVNNYHDFALRNQAMLSLGLDPSSFNPQTAAPQPAPGAPVQPVQPIVPVTQQPAAGDPFNLDMPKAPGMPSTQMPQPDQQQFPIYPNAQSRLRVKSPGAGDEWFSDNFNPTV